MQFILLNKGISSFIFLLQFSNMNGNTHLSINLKYFCIIFLLFRFRLNTMNDIFRKYVFKYSCQLSPVQNFKAFLISNNDIVMKLYILDICQFYVAKNMRPKYEFHNKDDIVKSFIHHDTFYKIKFSHLF